MSFFFIFVIAVSLSLDAFSLALSFGTLSINEKYKLYISSTVGIFHFFMPILGALFGSWFINSLHLEAEFIESVIFMYIAIIMFKDFKSEEIETFDISFLGIILFALGVSLDSFGVGFALNLGKKERVVSSMIFAIISFLFTFIGLKFGDKLNDLIGKYSVLVGSIIMMILSIINFCQFLF